jgi:hypothetical protein
MAAGIDKDDKWEYLDITAATTTPAYSNTFSASPGATDPKRPDMGSAEVAALECNGNLEFCVIAGKTKDIWYRSGGADKAWVWSRSGH